MTRRRVSLLAAGILLLAAGVRLGYWLEVRDEPFVAKLVGDSAEFDGWARGIASGDWLGSEAFFQPPLYPYLLAVVYALGGGLDTIYLLQVALAVLAVWGVGRVGRRLGGEGVGLAAMGLAALYGPFVFHDVQLMKESLAVLFVALLLWLTVSLRDSGRVWGWAGVGVLLGVLVLLRENAFLAGLFLVPLVFRAGEGRWAAGRRLALGLLGLALVLLPVAARNMAVGGGFLPTTFQGGANLWIGNHAGAAGTYAPLAPGAQVPALEQQAPRMLAERETGRELTPREVSRFWAGRVVDWALAEPAAFAKLQLRKLRLFWSFYEWPDSVDYYWMRGRSRILGAPLLQFGGVVILALAGLWIERRRIGPWSPVLLWTVGWTLSVVAFFVFSRYRLPVAPALIVLGAAPVAALGRSVAAGSLRRSAGLVVVLIAAWVVPALAGYAPRLDLVHHNLGRLAQERGDLMVAEVHYRQAAAVNEGFFLSRLNLGALAARTGRPEVAARWYAEAVALEPESAAAWTGLAATRLARGQLEPAREALEHALTIDPRHVEALHNLAVLSLAAGDLPGATEWNRRTLEVAPGFAPAERLRKRLAGAGARPAFPKSGDKGRTGGARGPRRADAGNAGTLSRRRNAGSRDASRADCRRSSETLV